MKVQFLLACTEESQTNQLVPFIEQRGWQVAITRTGAEALMQIERILPFISIVDVSLPDTTGWDVLEEVRQNPVVHELFVMLVYPVGAVIEDFFRGWRSGVDMSFVTPLDPLEVVFYLARSVEAWREYLPDVQQ